MKATQKHTDEYYLRLAIEAAWKARANGNHPFGALLVGPEGEVLLEGVNTVVTERDCTGHAETNLMREATKRFESDFLITCTMYASTEPCPMCSTAIYWGGVGRVVFGLSAPDIFGLTGEDPQNPVFLAPTREILTRGRQKIEVLGPMLVDEALRVHGGFWI
jgi:tRNA(Arg) A34 adenosine deaminase TadA